MSNHRHLDLGGDPILLENLYTPGVYLRWPSWFRHCATSRKVTGSIPNGVIVSFLSSGHTVALRLTQPLTEMSTRYISWGVKAAGA
jgi:hypothetical protein